GAGKGILMVAPSRLSRCGVRSPRADAGKATGERPEGGARAPSASLGDGDRAVLERAGSCQAADGGRIDVVGPGDVRLCLALPEARQRLITLMRGELARASEAHTTLLCSLAAFAGPGADQLALKLGQAAEDGEHQLAMRRGGVGPGALERPEASSSLRQLVEHVEQVPGRARQPVEAGDDEDSGPADDDPARSLAAALQGTRC